MKYLIIDQMIYQEQMYTKILNLANNSQQYYNVLILLQ